MAERQIISHLTDTDVYTFSLCYLYLKQFPRASGRYTFVDRSSTRYPPGFAEIVREQVRAMENIIISDDEISFMARKCYYYPSWFYTFLRGYRFDPDEVRISQDSSGHLQISIEGLLWKSVFWEIPLMALISELKHCLEGDVESYATRIEQERSRDKGIQLLNNGLHFAEFGTRRRFSYDHQDMVIRTLVELNKEHGSSLGSFVGTSNVHHAMRYDLTPIGTMSHQLISFCGAIFGYKEANFLAMSYWQDTFDSDLGIFLYDTYGWDAFQANFSKKFAKLFDGLRVDSGDNFEAVDKIIAKYKELTIPPLSKSLTFSNGLSVDEAVAIHRYCSGKINDIYGIGTALTGDVRSVEPMNIVIKLTAAKLTEKKGWQKAIKLSDDPGKATGDPTEVALAKEILTICK